MSDAIKAEIRKLEDRRFQAMIDSDFDTLDKLLGDGLIYTHSTAQSDTRAEYIALCKKGWGPIIDGGESVPVAPKLRVHVQVPENRAPDQC
jgi:hypothetical protein